MQNQDKKTGFATHELTVLICTHNRADLLERVISSLNWARRPKMPVRILVAANACTDDTAARMHAYAATQAATGNLPLNVIEVATAGKSHALNAAIPRIESHLIAFVDDDHRVDADYFLAIEAAADAWPDAGLYCGRIRPDWDGTEPTWVHDEGPYRIYPLPVPRYEQGDSPKTITADEGPIPGGGNLVVRREVFELCGDFSTELGPHGHDLGGGEDSEYVLRAMHRGVRCQYQPAMIQYHYVDNDRLTLIYLLKKGYQRTRSTARIHGNGSVPLYMWRKVAEYAFQSVFALSWSKRRFFLVRTAAALGEVQGRRESGHRGRGLNLPPDRMTLVLCMLGLVAALGMLAAWVGSDSSRWIGVLPVLGIATAGTAGLIWKSVADFSRTGPSIRDEVLAHYRTYSLLALARLGGWSFILMALFGGAGAIVWYMVGTLSGLTGSPWIYALAATLGIAVATALQLLRLLRFNPGLLVASMSYRMSRLHRLWRWATPSRIRHIEWLLFVSTGLLLLANTALLIINGRFAELTALVGAATFYAAIFAWSTWQPEAHAPKKGKAPSTSGRPNILMIGSDTLRADRLGAAGYHRALTPNIDSLAKSGVFFKNCFVPCARTAPSLVSLMTGTWPHTHGVRDNFVSDEQTRLKVDPLPTLLKAHGYRTAALSDWCGADLGKFSFGFELTDLPEDQWNLKYLIKQGPKDLRLFVSAFTHNRLGRLCLPELYYLGGAPLTTDIGRRGRHLLSRLAGGEQPFLLNIFYSTTHPPFASEWPWYEKYADPAYDDSSRFAMARLTDPFEIIRRQGAPKEEFDLDQVIDLYDGCVAQFDDEVGRIISHLDACGLTEQTIIVVYSDHGMEFFEHNTWGQGNSAIGDYSPRVPLVLKAPTISRSGPVEEVVRSVDVAPTLLELCGITPSAQIEGVSLVSYLRKELGTLSLDAYNETGLWMTTMPGTQPDHLSYPNLLELLGVPDPGSGTLAIKPEFSTRIIEAKDRMLRRGRWKLVYQPLENGHRLSLYDVCADPGCTVDVSREHPSVTSDLWKPLREILCADVRAQRR